MTPTCFDVSRENGIAHVVFNRPAALNTMVPAFWRELPEILTELDSDGGTRVVVLSSTGKHFTAGMDLSVFTSPGAVGSGGSKGEIGRQRANLRMAAKELQGALTTLEEVRMPVIAAIQGGCIGGGLDLISACDMRYATADAFFCIQEINIGMTADVGTLQRLPHLIPQGIVRELAYTGRRMPADRAQAVGLVNAVYADQAAMMAAVMETAREIAEKSPLAIHGTKVTINYSRDHSVADALEYIAVWQAGMYHPADMAESFQAKAEKRQPQFENLLPRRKAL